LSQPIDTEYIILENIYGSQQEPLRQRDLAQIAGASLGMTNSILKRMAQKGWITIKKLNSRNIQYAVTLEGINEIIHRSYGYFKRTIRNVVYYKDILEDIVCQAKQRNIDTVILVGSSDLDFIVEHACRRWALTLIRVKEREKLHSSGKLRRYSDLKTCFIIYAEGINKGALAPGGKTGFVCKENQGNIYYLSQLIMKQASARFNEN
jgi:predicted transcriptional regulator